MASPKEAGHSSIPKSYCPLRIIGEVGLSDPAAFSTVTPNAAACAFAGSFGKIIAALPR